MKRWHLPFAISLAVALSVNHATAEVVRIVIDSRGDVLDGRSFGAGGPYEKIVGRIFFAFDPANPMNARVVDLDRAPRNAEGLVEAWANFVVLRPKFPPDDGSIALLEVSNRGGKASLRYFNGGVSSLDPTSEEHFGDGFLMRRGITLIWVGWQHDVPLREGLVRLHVPVATDSEPLQGLVRSDWTVDRATATLALGHRNHVAYPVSAPAHPDNILTVRDGRLAPRVVIPRDQWRFAREEGGRIVADQTSIYSSDGFEAGKIYELVYRAENPRVVGLGLAAIRDMMSYAKYDPSSPFAVDHGIAIGISQTGRFLRHFIYQGFNTDERSRKVFDGLMIHTAGAGRGSFNHRFGQPSRDAHRYSAFFYPTDIFPFTSRTQTDAETGATDGLFAHQHNRDHLPNIFYTNTGYEYWGRAASLIHTTVDGTNDVPLFPNERLYHIASAQHSPRPFPPPADAQLQGSAAFRWNPMGFLITLRALFTRMSEWVRDGAAPPPSAYPQISAGNLVSIDRVSFPQIPGVSFPAVVHEAYRADYGQRWQHGIVDQQPPSIGSPFPVLVPQVDELGNEYGGVRSVELLAPLATYTPWSLRTGYAGGTHELVDFTGTYVPLPSTEAERRGTGDPRPSIDMLYRSWEEYQDVVESAAHSLVEQGFLLGEDVPAVLERAGLEWEWIHSRR
jgi:hypothetical protein